MAAHTAVLCHDEVGHFIHPMSHERNLGVTPTYVVRIFLVYKKQYEAWKDTWRFRLRFVIHKLQRLLGGVTGLPVIKYYVSKSL